MSLRDRMKRTLRQDVQFFRLPSASQHGHGERGVRRGLRDTGCCPFSANATDAEIVR
jgi:hypothetical protein